MSPGHDSTNDDDLQWPRRCNVIISASVWFSAIFETLLSWCSA